MKVTVALLLDIVSVQSKLLLIVEKKLYFKGGHYYVKEF